jgi:hypothetical protein
MERWRAIREAFVAVLRNRGLVAADQYGIRRDDAAEKPHISILSERKLTLRERLLVIPTAAWIGTAYFPNGFEGRIVIEVFGHRNLPVARRLAWLLSQETGVDVEARVAHPHERTETEDCPRSANVDGWGSPLP